MSETQTVEKKVDLPEDVIELQDKVKALEKKVSACQSNVTNMESRVQEIENFRNTASIEGKMNGFTTSLESINDALSLIRSDFKKELAKRDEAIEAIKKEFQTPAKDTEKAV